METALRRVAVKERKAQQAAAATQATEANPNPTPNPNPNPNPSPKPNPDPDPNPSPSAMQATEAWLESDAAEATPWGGGRRLSRKEDPLRKGDPTQVRVRAR